MNWLLYISLTFLFYIISLVKLKSQIERDRIRITPLFWVAIIFFAIFEYVFLESIFKNFTFHLIGLVLSILYAVSIYFYLKNQKKQIDLIFAKLVKENQGTISVLSFMLATQLSKTQVEEYLDKKLKELQGNRNQTEGNIYYEFYNW